MKIKNDQFFNFYIISNNIQKMSRMISRNLYPKFDKSKRWIYNDMIIFSYDLKTYTKDPKTASRIFNKGNILYNQKYYL